MRTGCRLSGRILRACGACAKLNVTSAGLAHTSLKLYVLIDEYDNFTNTILAESGLNAYNELCHGDGFGKQIIGRIMLAYFMTGK